MTIGDVLAVTAGIAASGTAWVATILLFALAFPMRAAAAQEKMTTAPGACLIRGISIVLVGGMLAVICWHAAAGPVRPLAGVIAGAVCLTAAVGSAGAVRFLGEQIQAQGSPMTPFSSLTRASVLYVLAGFLPVIGWFLILPAALFLSVGSGASALLSLRQKPAPRRVEIEAVA